MQETACCHNLLQVTTRTPYFMNLRLQVLLHPREVATLMQCDYILPEYTDLLDAWKVYQGVALYRYCIWAHCILSNYP